jgi:uncharacterized RDD family membrane protein YckC
MTASSAAHEAAVVAPAPAVDVAVQAGLAEDVQYVGLATRAISWVIDAVLINLVAIITGLGVALVLSIFHLPTQIPTLMALISGAVYILWIAGYFVVFWSTTGQTPGARFMQIRLVSSAGKTVKPHWALIRWIGMNLAAIPLFAGYLPILFDDRRRGFPDWLGRTLVIEAPSAPRGGARGRARHETS